MCVWLMGGVRVCVADGRCQGVCVADGRCQAVYEELCGITNYQFQYVSPHSITVY